MTLRTRAPKPRPTLVPVEASDIRRIGGVLGLRSLLLHSKDFPAVIPEQLSPGSVTTDEVVRLSEGFVDDRVSTMARLGVSVDPGVHCPILFLPVRQPAAMVFSEGDAHYCILTLGLTHLLGYQSTVSVWQEAMTRLAAELGTSMDQVQDTARYLNVRSIRFLDDVGVLPRLADEVASPLRARAAVLGDLAVDFVIFHEMGHVAYAGLGPTEREAYRDAIELDVDEPLGESKVEELFADAYALSRFPADVQALAIRAAITFFQLLAFREATGLSNVGGHPRTRNRIAHLERSATPGERSAEATTEMVREQLVGMRHSDSTLRRVRWLPEDLRTALFDSFDEVSSEVVDWRQTVRACNLLMESLGLE